MGFINALSEPFHFLEKIPKAENAVAATVLLIRVVVSYTGVAYTGGGLYMIEMQETKTTSDYLENLSGEGRGISISHKIQ